MPCRWPSFAGQPSPNALEAESWVWFLPIAKWRLLVFQGQLLILEVSHLKLQSLAGPVLLIEHLHRFVQIRLAPQMGLRFKTPSLTAQNKLYHLHACMRDIH